VILDAAILQVAGIDVTCHSRSRIARVSCRKSGSLPASILFCRARGGQQLLDARAELARELDDELERLPRGGWIRSRGVRYR